MKLRAIQIMAALVLAACGSSSNNNKETQQEAALRNEPPATCTVDQVKACAAPEITKCADGELPVLDYSSDCCLHFTCVPVCVSAQKSCPRTPAPVCPAGTKLWIGTAIQDCCPAYRCEPEAKKCSDDIPEVCLQAPRICGDGVEPVMVGKTDECCPIYQCPPCVDSTTAPNVKCGCTIPVCTQNQQLVCKDGDRCACTCEPAPDCGGTTCNSDEHCETRCNAVVKTSTDAVPEECDPTACTGQDKPAITCDNPEILQSPTVRCTKNVDSKCIWQEWCPICTSTCVKNDSGCTVDAECAKGEKCVKTCEAQLKLCAIDNTAPGCINPTECKGVCEPVIPCDSSTTVCTQGMPVCPNGQDPIKVGYQDNCCPKYECPLVCTDKIDAVNTVDRMCPLVGCRCMKMIGLDDRCCPSYECLKVADGQACPL